MNRKRIVIVGSSFAGFTAALELQKKLGGRHELTVVSKSAQFLFMPSLIWVPFGLRTPDQITFDVREPLERLGISFVHTEVTRLDLANRTLTTKSGLESYDYLLLATGPKANHAAVPGLGPRGYTQSILSLPEAENARRKFESFVAAPGPVVVGAVQGASCFGAAYEFVLNLAYQLQKRGVSGRAPVVFLTAEPYLGHFGVGGFGAATPMIEDLFRRLGVDAITSAAIDRVERKEIHLKDGRRLPFAYAMLVPPLLGVDVVRACVSITDASGFVEVNEFYQTHTHPEVFAAGAAVAVAPREGTEVPWGVPKTGYLCEEMAKVAAHNIVAHLEGTPMTAAPAAELDAKSILDAGDTGMVLLGDHYLEPREQQWVIPGPEAHWAKLAFEKYFIETRKHGFV